MLTPDSEIQYVKGVGPRRAALLASRGVRTVEDLLLRIPRAYQDRSRFTPLNALIAGSEAAARVKVYRSRTISTRTRGRILEVVVTDGSNYARAKWFHGGYLRQNDVFAAGRELILFGRVEYDRRDTGFVFFNPEFEPLDEEAPGAAASLDVGRIVPIYEEIGGLTSRQLRRIVAAAIAGLPPQLDDPLPETLRRKHGFPDLRVCLERIHFPAAEDSLEALETRSSPYHRRLIFEELFLLELVFALRRRGGRSVTGARFETNDHIREQVRRMLPFHPTAAQKRVLKEIVDDLKASFPMSRLMQGDVGSGKTIVAFQAIVIAIENGYQAAIMAPTEILAEQHYINARRILAPLHYSTALIRGGAKKSEKKEALEGLATGRVQLAIGTHALVEGDAAFHRLGLVVIDEQHRFGVMQRLKLMTKGENPNTLVMTATPIPRTLAMAVFGDLDLSVIDELPPGRSPIRTVHITERDAARVYAAIGEELARGRQCYVVYPLIEESEKVDLQSATEGFEKLSQVFAGRRVALLHGRMKSAEKEAIMRAFASGEIDVLVSTTVIEVGVDVANATSMLVMSAERFGLAQLHQLRGRVGRGSHQSMCMLMTPARLGDTARQRIAALTQTTDGFRLAEIDLKLRGPGDVAGTRQSGMPELRVANLMEDSMLLALAQKEARAWVDRDDDRERLLAAMSARLGRLAPAMLATIG
ncbi:MAG TPA: ATP-dependent DNA helicase RecG [Terriglobia bacterium]|nr:ATP-dependent DNA helicase RecG [Terriglobia bacterium]